MSLTNQNKISIALGVVALLGLVFIPTVRRQMNDQINHLSNKEATRLVKQGCLETGQIVTPATGIRFNPIGPGPFSGSSEDSTVRRFKCTDESIHDLPNGK